MHESKKWVIKPGVALEDFVIDTLKGPNVKST